MTNEQTPPPEDKEILTEAECAKRLSVRRETLSRLRRAGMPHVPLGDGPAPKVRYVWADVVAWLRARQRNHPASGRRRGRPRNVDRRTDGGAL